MPCPVLVLRTLTHSATRAPELSMMSWRSVELVGGRWKEERSSEPWLLLDRAWRGGQGGVEEAGGESAAGVCWAGLLGCGSSCVVCAESSAREREVEVRLLRSTRVFTLPEPEQLILSPSLQRLHLPFLYAGYTSLEGVCCPGRTWERETRAGSSALESGARREGVRGQGDGGVGEEKGGDGRGAGQRPTAVSLAVFLQDYGEVRRLWL